MQHRASISCALVLALSLAACDDKQPPSPKTSPSTSTVASGSAPPVASSAVASSSAQPKVDGASKPPTEKKTIYVLAGTIGKETNIQLYVERVGKKLEGLYQGEYGGTTQRLRGEMTEGEKFRLDELDPQGKPIAVFDGAFFDGLMKGTYKDTKTNKPSIFVTSPHVLTEKKFKGAYLGSLGPKLRIRAKLEVDDGKIKGLYRYARSKSDLSLDGTVDAKGMFVITESSLGKPTGRFDGAFLSPGFAVGTWSTVDGARSYPMSMQTAGSYPEIVNLPGGVARIVPQESFKETTKSCVTTDIEPEVDGLAKKDVQKKLNDALKQASGTPAFTNKDECDGADENLPYEAEASYRIVVSTKPYFGIVFTSYEFAGGAHGMYGESCNVADLNAGTVSDLNKQLTPEGRAKLTTMVNERFKKDEGVTTLGEAGFFDDTVKVTDTTNVCFADDGGLDVTYGVYEVGPYVMGMPSVHFEAAEVRELFAKGSVGEALFK